MGHFVVILRTYLSKQLMLLTYYSVSTLIPQGQLEGGEKK